MSGTNWVRIRTESGAEVTVNRDAVRDESQLIDAPATNRHGAPLPATRRNGRPPKPRTTVAQEAAKRAVGPSPKGASVPALTPPLEEATE